MVTMADFAFKVELAASCTPRSMPSAGALTVDATASAPASAVSRSSMTWTHVVGANANLLTIAIPYAGGGSVTTSSVTVNGAPILGYSRATSSAGANNRLVDVWYMKNPPVGTVTIVVTQSGSNDCDGASISWNNADPNTPLSAAVISGAATGTSAGPLSPVGGSYVFAACSVRATGVQTVSGSPTTVLKRVGGAFSNLSVAVVYAPVTYSPTFSGWTSDENAAVAIAVNPAGTYTDISAYLKMSDPIAMSRGRADEQTVLASAGRASLALKNGDARFTPGNGSSPYAPVRIRRPIRISVVYAATTYPLWQGFVDDWDNGQDGLLGVAQVSLSDRLARLGKNKFNSALDAEILSDSPSLYYPLSESSGGASAANATGSGGVLQPTTTNSSAAVSFGAGQVGPDAQSQAAFTAASDGSGWYLAGDPIVAGSPTTGTVEAVVRCTAAAPSMLGFGQVAVAACELFGVGVSALGVPYAFFDGRGLVNTFVTASAVDSVIGVDAHLAARYSFAASTITLDLLVNGKVTATTTQSVPYWSGSSRLTIGNYYGASVPQGTSGFSGRISNVAYYPTALATARLADHAAGVITKWNGEATSDRFLRLCRVGGVPATWYAAAASSTIAMGVQPLAGKTLIDAITDVATVENGVVYVNASGVLTFAPRTVRYRASSAVTLDASKAGHVGTGAQAVTNDAFLINDSTVTGPGGQRRNSDATSVNSYDAGDETLSLLCRYDDTAAGLAEWHVLSFKDPRARFNDALEVDVVAFANSGGNVAQLLTADIGSKLTAATVPTHMAPTGSMALFVEGVAPVIGKDSFKLRFTTSPVALEDSTFIAEDATFGVIGAGYPIPY